MATFFGEIRAFSSRAIDDEEADNLPSYDIIIDEHSSYSKNSELIIFAIGDMASVFAKSYFLADNHVLISTFTSLCHQKVDDSTFYTDMKQKVKNVVAKIYASNPSIIICDIPGSVPDEVCYDTAEIVFKKFSPSRVLVITSQHMATFKKENSTSYDMPFLKSLCTSSYQKNHLCKIPRLNSPNFLSSITASILLKCEVLKLPALCVINFVDTNAVDSLNIEVFCEVLKEDVVSNVAINEDASSRAARYVISNMSGKSNLYT